MGKKTILATIAGVWVLLLIPQPVSANHQTVGAPCAAGTSSTVTIVNFAFSPTPLTIDAGDIVVFDNTANNGHTSTEDYLFDNNGLLAPFGRIIDPPQWDLGVIAGQTTHSLQFCNAGTFDYHCEIHRLMRATINVV